MSSHVGAKSGVSKMTDTKNEKCRIFPKLVDFTPQFKPQQFTF